MNARLTSLLAVVPLAAAVLLVTAVVAHAGSYAVHACDDAAGGANNSWAAAASSDQLAVYAACPSGGDPKRGMITRTAVASAGSSLGPGSFARFQFDAPAGTVITAIRASYRFYRGGYTGWEAALSNGSAVLKGCGAFDAPCLSQGTDEIIGVPNNSAIYIDVFCARSPCPIDSTGDPVYGYVQATSNLYSASVTLEDDSAPGMGALTGGLTSGGWKRASQPVTFDASDNSGISQTRVQIDGQPAGSADKVCDFTVTVPCPQGGQTFDVDTSIVKQDGAHTVTVQAIDAGGNVAQASRQVQIDNTSPGPPQHVELVGGDGWRSANGFTVNWQNPSEAGAAPIAGANWQICPASGSDRCQTGHADGDDLKTAPKIQVPADGDYVLRLWLRDAAGNTDERTAADPIHLRFDDQAPQADFAVQDPTDPTLLAVNVHDATSGLGSGTVEVKRTTSTAWTPLVSRVVGNRLVANIDDEHLHDGVYDVRAQAVDQAGNEHSTTTHADASPMQLTLPVRVETRMSAGAVHRTRRHGRAHTALIRRPHVRFGQRTRLHARLTSKDGTPLADTEVQVVQLRRQTGATWTPVATLKTSRKGGVSYLAPKGVSRTVRLRYAGTAVVRPANGDVQLRVAAHSTIAAPRRHYVNGEVARFRGRLSGGNIPAEGKLVELQVQLRGRFRTFTTARADHRGRWHYDYRFDGTQGRQTYRFRARVPREATYPFETGVSRGVTVVVQGL